MSTKVELADLGAAIEQHAFAYLVTVGDDDRAHVLAVWPTLADAELVVGGVGRHSQANATVHPEVTLVWPPATDGGYTLLVDGVATVDDSTITVSPTKAILHRPAAAPDGTRQGSDCQPIKF